MIYGLAKEVEDNCTGAKMCFNYEISSLLVELANSNTYETVKRSEFKSDYMHFNLNEMDMNKVKMGNIGLENFVKAFMQIKSGDVDAGLVSLGKKDTTILGKQEEVEQYFAKAISAEKLGNYNAMLEALNKAIELKTDDAKLYFYRGIVHNKSKLYNKSIADFDKACLLYTSDAADE